MSQGSIEKLKLGLSEKGTINYRSNGCRMIDGPAFLERALEIGKKIGITRIARISELIDVGYPVFQATRPHIWDHTNSGMNTGSQGKGPTEVQSMISCLMESLESYAMEPRNPFLIRASFRELSASFVVVDPRRFVRSYNCKEVNESEPLLWTKAYFPLIDSETLVPAEGVYFPLHVYSYKTRSIFPRGYNGFAAGTSYLDATIHAMYEVIERKFQNICSFGKARIQKVSTAQDPRFFKMTKLLVSSHRFDLYLVSSENLPNIPVFRCDLHGIQKASGWGCNFDFEIAAERAISEAIECCATAVSSSREDVQWDLKHVSNRWIDPLLSAEPAKFEDGPEIEKRTVFFENTEIAEEDLATIKSNSGHRYFDTLQEEYQALIHWLKEAQYPVLYILDVTPDGIDVPVVKVIVPQMSPAPIHRRSFHYSDDTVIKYKYRTISTDNLNP